MNKTKGLLPIGSIILIAIGALWLAQDAGYLSTNISWLPIVLIIAGIGMLINNYHKI